MQYAIAVVIGGGPAGSAAAIAVAQSGLTVVLVTRSTPECFKPGEMLPPNARPLLARLGIPDLCSLGHANASGVRSRWDHPEIGETDFLFNPYGTGWFLDRIVFDQQLLTRASESGARVLSSNRAAVVNVRRTGTAWELILGPSLESETLKCDFLIDATGRSSWLARCLGIPRVSMDQLIGVSALLPGRLLEDDRLYLQACEDGWWYVASLPGDKSVVTWMTDSDLATRFPGGGKKCATQGKNVPPTFLKNKTCHPHGWHFHSFHSCQENKRWVALSFLLFFPFLPLSLPFLSFLSFLSIPSLNRVAKPTEFHLGSSATSVVLKSAISTSSGTN